MILRHTCQQFGGLGFCLRPKIIPGWSSLGSHFGSNRFTRLLFVQISHNHNNKSPKAERDVGPPPSLRINYKSNTTIIYYYYLKELSGSFNPRSRWHPPLISTNTTILASLCKVQAPQPSSTLVLLDHLWLYSKIQAPPFLPNIINRILQ